MKHKGRIIAAIVVLATVGAVVAGLLVSQQGARPTVTTARAGVQNLSVTISAPGTVTAATRVPVYPPAVGVLASVRVTDGQQVAKGDVLATLDGTALQAAVDRAKAQVAAADAQSAAASAQRAAAKAMPRDTDAQARARDAALDAADAAQDAAGAAQSAAAAARKAAEADAAKTSIVAPAAGTVTLPVLAITSLDGTGPTAAPGASVSPASPVFTIVDLAALVFAAQVDESDVAEVAPGQQTRVTLDAHPGRSFEGTVAEVATASVTTKTGGVAYVVKVPLTPADASLRLGMSGDAAIATADVPAALVVPVQAVVTDGGKRYVFRVTGDKVQRVEVSVGATTDTLAQVTAGLADGDVVATGQLTALTDGATVRVA